MDKEVFARCLFGASLSMHQILTAALPGTAIGLLMPAFFAYRKPQEGYAGIFALFLRLFAIQFSIATISGIVLDLQLGENWSRAQHVLGPLINHPYGRIALLAFFGTAFLLLFLFRKPKLPFWLTALIVLLLFVFSICFSVWTLIVNAWMHTPAGAVFSQTPGGLSAQIVSMKEFAFNPSCFGKLTHLYLAGTMAGFIFYSVVLAWLSKKMCFCPPASRFSKTIFY